MQLQPTADLFVIVIFKSISKLTWNIKIFNEI